VDTSNTGGRTATARIWDVATGKTLHVLTGHSDQVDNAAFSPDSKWVLTSSADKTARSWDVQTGAEIRRFLGHTDQLSWAEFSPDGKLAITASSDRTARLWDVQTGKEVRRVSPCEGVEAVAFAPMGKRSPLGTPLLGRRSGTPTSRMRFVMSAHA
jgi:WD40 repeat protein